MRITERRLRQIIRNVIKESDFVYPNRYDDDAYERRYGSSESNKSKVEGVLRYHNNQPVSLDDFMTQIVDSCTYGNPKLQGGLGDRAYDLVYIALEDHGSFDSNIADNFYMAPKGAYHASVSEADAVWSIDPRNISNCASAIIAACARID